MAYTEMENLGPVFKQKMSSEFWYNGTLETMV